MQTAYKKYDGIEVFSSDRLEIDNSYNKIVVTPTEYSRDIIFRLIENGIPKHKIIDWGTPIKQLLEGQYFDLPFLRCTDDEVFIDAGGFDGMSSVRFARWAKKFKHIYIFEPDEDNILKCQETLQKENIFSLTTLVNKGCWSKNTTLHFHSSGDILSYICEDEQEDSELVEVVGIDEILDGERATFVKMDIEGSELEALKGAEKAIKTWKPKLAVCAYHKPEDIITIPKLILEYNPEYKLYIRHYSHLDLAETVLYEI